MHKLLVLTVDSAKPGHEQSIVVTCSDGSSQTYHFVDRIDGLLHYRNDAVSEDEARRLVA